MNARARACLGAIGLCLLLSACSGGPSGTRAANTLEFAYSFLAAKLDMPEVCDKISPRAVLRAGWGGEGAEIAYARSACYYKLAQQTGRAAYCAPVIEARHWWLSGSRFTEEHCREALAGGRDVPAAGGDPEWVTRFMGFTEADLRGRDWIGLFHDITLRGRHRDRARSLPDFSAADGHVVAALSTRDMGCRGADDRAWHCYARRCLDSADETLREACLEVAGSLQVAQREQALGNAFSPSRRIRDLLEAHPELAPRPASSGH